MQQERLYRGVAPQGLAALTLALGGFFMVRYSIEAGLLGPGVRTVSPPSSGQA